MNTTQEKPIRMIVTGGGTGGHLFPGIAVAEFALAARPGSEVLFVSTDRAVDQRALTGRAFRTAAVRGQGLKGMGAGARLRAMFQLPLALGEAIMLVRRFRPQLVLGVGGYVTGPVVLAARLLGIPACIHEQNSVPGLANRWLGRLVDRIFLSIPGSESWFPPGRTVLTGNPVRRELLAAGEGVPGPATLLVLGGSQGAHRVNTLVVEALIGIRDRLPAGFTVIHQTGAKDEQWVAAAYQEHGIEARVAAFFDDMAALYRQAALVVSRAGATTLAELTVAGKPALLIPYPYAADNHQEKNGDYLVAGGAARMFRESKVDGATLGGEILGLLTGPERLAQMAARATSLARPDATAAIMAECLRLIESKHV